MRNDEEGKQKLVAALEEFGRVRQQCSDALERLQETREREGKRLGELLAIVTAQVKH
jgi:hypothetical protein